MRNVVGTAARQTGFHSWCSTDHVFAGLFVAPLHRCCSHADGYRTLMNVQDELGIDELFKVRLGILQGAIFMAIDVTLDNVNGIIYCWRGLKVFGPLTLAREV